MYVYFHSYFFIFNKSSLNFDVSLIIHIPVDSTMLELFKTINRLKIDSIGTELLTAKVGRVKLYTRLPVV